MNEKKCPFCGGFLPVKPFYYMERFEGTLEIYLCPKCGSRVKDWRQK